MGAFEQVVQALHRLMDLKEKYLDVEVEEANAFHNILLAPKIFLRKLW